ACEQQRAQAGEAHRHHGVHVRDSVPATADEIRSRPQGAARRLHRLLEGLAQALRSKRRDAVNASDRGYAGLLQAARKDQAMIDGTHSPARRSGAASANQPADFPIQTLPLCVFAPPGGAARGGVAIGDDVFDLAAALELGLFDGLPARAAEAASGATLNPLFALGREARVALRRRLGDLLDADRRARTKVQALRSRLLHRGEDCRLELPAAIGDYTDFFAGIHHATNAGKLFRPDNPLLPNYKYVPIGYHGRASSIPCRARRCAARAASANRPLKRFRASGPRAVSTTSSSSQFGSAPATSSAHRLPLRTQRATSRGSAC